MSHFTLETSGVYGEKESSIFNAVIVGKSIIRRYLPILSTVWNKVLDGSRNGLK